MKKTSKSKAAPTVKVSDKPSARTASPKTATFESGKTVEVKVSKPTAGTAPQTFKAPKR